MRILLVEDELVLAASLSTRLKSEGFVVDRFGTLSEATEAVLATEYRLVLLDRRLPDGDGVSLLPVIRSRGTNCPVVILTAMDDVSDRVTGLDAGAEDYLVKPFAIAELLARMRALLRRDVSFAQPKSVTVGALEYDLSNREPSVRGLAFQLRPKELAVLDVLLRRAGRLVLREHLGAQVYGYQDDINSNTLEAHVSRLRKRLADVEAEAVVHVVRGLGYMIKAS